MDNLEQNFCSKKAELTFLVSRSQALFWLSVGFLAARMPNASLDAVSVEEMTVRQLRAELGQRGLDTKGLKVRV